MKLNITIKEARNLYPADFNGFSDPYCVVSIFGEEFRTKVKKKTLNPSWEETFSVSLEGGSMSHRDKESPSELHITIYDHDLIGKHEFLGQIVISDLKTSSSKWHTLESRKGKKDKVKGELFVVVDIPKEEVHSGAGASAGGKKKTIYRYVKRNKLDELKKAIEDPEVNIDAKNHRENSALHYAARQGSLEFISILAQYHADINILDSHHNTPLHIALVRSHTDAALALINAGANVNLPNKDQNLALHFAARLHEPNSEKLLSVLQTIVSKSADINPNNSKMETPLHLAVEAGNDLSALFLLKKGANPSIPSSEGLTPLHIACSRGMGLMIEILMCHGANPGIKTSQGSCFDVAERTNNRAVICRLFERYNLTPTSVSREHSLDEHETLLNNFLQKQEVGGIAIGATSRGRGNTSIVAASGTTRGRSLSVSSSLVNEHDASTQFVISKNLGEGAFGSVFRAKHKESGFVVAIKTMNLTEEQKASIQKETGILQKCSHPHIVQYYGSFVKGDKVYLIMELCTVGCVLDLMKVIERPFTESEVLSITYQVIKGLEYLHDNRIIHRDMKPQNILATNHGVMKITDFGVSGQMESGQQAKTCVGTPLYMAPEVFLGDPYDFTADIWSLGITIIHIAQGHAPYNTLPVMVAINNLTTKPPPTLNEPNKFGEGFNSLIAACLIKKPSDRAKSADLAKHPIFTKEMADEKALEQLMSEWTRRKSAMNQTPTSVGTPTASRKGLALVF